LQNINAPTLPVYKCDLHLIHAQSGILIERSISMATNNISHLSTIAAEAVFLPMRPGYWRTSMPPWIRSTSNSSNTRGSTTSKPLCGVSGVVVGL